MILVVKNPHFYPQAQEINGKIEIKVSKTPFKSQYSKSN